MSALAKTLDRILAAHRASQEPSREDVAALAKVSSMIDDVIALGRITHRQRAVFIDLAFRHPDVFNRFLASAPRREVRTATAEFFELAQDRVAASSGQLSLADALIVIANEEPDLRDQVDAERRARRG